MDSLGDLGGLNFKHITFNTFSDFLPNLQIFDKKVQKWPKMAIFALFGQKRTKIYLFGLNVFKRAFKLNPQTLILLRIRTKMRY